MTHFMPPAKLTKKQLAFGLTLLICVLVFAHQQAPTPNAPITPEQPSVEMAGNLTIDGVSEDWWTAAQQHLVQREYHFSEDTDKTLPDHWQAPNRAQNLRFRISAESVQAEPRKGISTKWNWSWRTVAFGREQNLQVVPAVNAQTDLNRLHYQRDGFKEWYLNSPEGLEQGFDLTAAPAGQGRLCLEAEILSSLTPHQINTREGNSDQSISYMDQDGSAYLTYNKLVAFDSTGRNLPSEMQITEVGLRLLVEDTNAIYPITIDPLLSTPAWTKEGGNADAEFGFSVCTAGDVNGDGFGDIICGAPGYSDYERGGAFVYHGTADGLHSAPDWDYIHYNNGARCGTSVAGLGDVNGDGYDDIAFGSPEFGDGHTGEVRVYHGGPTGLSPVSNFTETGDATVDAFGAIVAAAGDVNGDGYADLVTKKAGEVYVYHGSSTGLRHSGYWHEDDSGSFGAALAGVGDVNGDGYDDLLIGSPTWDTYSHDEAGRAQLFLGSDSGLEHTPDWTTLGGQRLVRRGKAVASAGDMNGDGYADFLVSTPYTVSTYTHSVRCYYGSDTGPVTGWTSTGDHVSNTYGTAVAPAGDINGDGYADVLIASESYIDGTDYVGRVDAHYGGPSVTGDAPDWSITGTQDYEYFGGAVGPAGDVNGDGFGDIIIGARGWSNPQVNEGRVVVYLGSPSLPTPAPNWVVDSNQIGAQFGSSVACIGDANGDGYSDVLVGARAYDHGQTNEGAAFLYLGTLDGLMVLPFWYCESNQTNAYMGEVVSAAGDVNGDGYSDVLITAPFYAGLNDDEGRAFVWHSVLGGTPLGTPENADWVGSYPQEDAKYGHSAASAGDVNGDGYGDIIVGAPYYDRGTTDEGIALVYHGSETGLSEDYDWLHDCNHNGAAYGFSVASAGDFNGDGYDDVIVGSPYYNHPEVDEGMVWIYLGSSTGVVPGAPHWWAESNEIDARLGISVASTGDVGQDGFCGVMAAAPSYDGTTANGGAVFAWRGGPSTTSPESPSTAYWNMLGNQEDGLEWGQVAPAGDINADGYGDIIIGLPFYDTAAGSNAGGILLYLGSDDGLVEGVADGWALGDQSYGFLGRSVACAGDVNGDGFDDIVMGAYLYDAGELDEGRLYLFYGNGPNGRVRKVKQMCSDFSGPITRMGRSESETAFGLDVMARSAGGRGRARLEWQVDEYPGTFLSPASGVSDWFDTGVPDGAMGSRVFIQTVVDGLAAGNLYSWRVRVRTDDPAFAGSPWHNLPETAQTSPMLRTAGGTTDVAEDQTPSMQNNSLRNYPNPFNPTTTFHFKLAQREQVKLRVFDLAGRLVATVHDGPLDAGNQQLDWHGSDANGRILASGVYCAQLVSGKSVSTTKITLTK